MIDQIKRIILLLIAALLFGVILHLTGEEVEVVWLRYVPTVAGILIIPITLFDVWLWKTSETIVRRPRLYGTWRGLIHSEWKNPRTGQKPDPIECYVAITQTYSTIVIR